MLAASRTETDQNPSPSTGDLRKRTSASRNNLPGRWATCFTSGSMQTIFASFRIGRGCRTGPALLTRLWWMARLEAMLELSRRGVQCYGVAISYSSSGNRQIGTSYYESPLYCSPKQTNPTASTSNSATPDGGWPWRDRRNRSGNRSSAARLPQETSRNNASGMMTEPRCCRHVFDAPHCVDRAAPPAVIPSVV